ncbi:DNA-binding transcriptional LysR family regulator [Duganella sp. 1224]|uniref:LysR family transcriptional regulator n=1 Tax=Duganella sp. 1224 TaxID=2587052 RepID=UPI0015CAACEC|nr:LysR family transcriptional regulator [Duganella sp. 1224]NYE63180.1 DNA-binding transcriptional LysR family regulator [Duganella sp. 1224]
MDNRSGEMQVFARVVEAGGFSAAAELLNMTPSAVSKLVSRTEARLGVQLFKRSTRSVTLTAEGREFYANCVRILQDIEDAELSVTRGVGQVRGLLRVNASLPFGQHYLVPLLKEFKALYPEIRIDISLTDAKVALQREEVDVAIRMGPLHDATFRARKLGSSRKVVVAAPSYLALPGKAAPQTPADLAHHNCLNFNFRRALDEWPFLVDGQVLHLAVDGDAQANNGETMRQLTLQGLGVSRLGMFHVFDDIQRGDLVELLPDYNAGDIEEITLIYPHQKHIPPRVRAFIDFAVARLSPILALKGDVRLAENRR